jgi:hypothetical protein
MRRQRRKPRMTAGLGPLAVCATPLVIPGHVSWQLQLDGRLQKPNRHLYDTPQQTIGDLKSAGRIVICYFSAGTWENWRSDAAAYPAAALGAPLADWPGERWLDIRRADGRALLSKRLDLAVSKGYRLKFCKRSLKGVGTPCK